MARSELDRLLAQLGSRPSSVTESKFQRWLSRLNQRQKALVEHSYLSWLKEHGPVGISPLRGWLQDRAEEARHTSEPSRALEQARKLINKRTITGKPGKLEERDDTRPYTMARRRAGSVFQVGGNLTREKLQQLVHLARTIRRAKNNYEKVAHHYNHQMEYLERKYVKDAAAVDKQFNPAYYRDESSRLSLVRYTRALVTQRHIKEVEKLQARINSAAASLHNTIQQFQHLAPDLHARAQAQRGLFANQVHMEWDPETEASFSPAVRTAKPGSTSQAQGYLGEIQYLIRITLAHTGEGGDLGEDPVVHQLNAAGMAKLDKLERELAYVEQLRDVVSRVDDLAAEKGRLQKKVERLRPAQRLSASAEKELRRSWESGHETFQKRLRAHHEVKNLSEEQQNQMEEFLANGFRFQRVSARLTEVQKELHSLVADAEKEKIDVSRSRKAAAASSPGGERGEAAKSRAQKLTKHMQDIEKEMDAIGNYSDKLERSSTRRASTVIGQSRFWQVQIKNMPISRIWWLAHDRTVHGLTVIELGEGMKGQDLGKLFRREGRKDISHKFPELQILAAQRYLRSPEGKKRHAEWMQQLAQEEGVTTTKSFAEEAMEASLKKGGMDRYLRELKRARQYIRKRDTLVRHISNVEKRMSHMLKARGQGDISEPRFHQIKETLASLNEQLTKLDSLQANRQALSMLRQERSVRSNLVSSLREEAAGIIAQAHKDALIGIIKKSPHLKKVKWTELYKAEIGELQQLVQQHINATDAKSQKALSPGVKMPSEALAVNRELQKAKRRAKWAMSGDNPRGKFGFNTLYRHYLGTGMSPEQAESAADKAVAQDRHDGTAWRKAWPDLAYAGPKHTEEQKALDAEAAHGFNKRLAQAIHAGQKTIRMERQVRDARTGRVTREHYEADIDQIVDQLYPKSAKPGRTNPGRYVLMAQYIPNWVPNSSDWVQMKNNPKLMEGSDKHTDPMGILLGPWGRLRSIEEEILNVHDPRQLENLRGEIRRLFNRFSFNEHLMAQMMQNPAVAQVLREAHPKKLSTRSMYSEEQVRDVLSALGRQDAHDMSEQEFDRLAKEVTRRGDPEGQGQEMPPRAQQVLNLIAQRQRLLRDIDEYDGEILGPQTAEQNNFGRWLDNVKEGRRGHEQRRAALSEEEQASLEAEYPLPYPNAPGAQEPSDDHALPANQTEFDVERTGSSLSQAKLDQKLDAEIAARARRERSEAIGELPEAQEQAQAWTMPEPEEEQGEAGYEGTGRRLAPPRKAPGGEELPGA